MARSWCLYWLLAAVVVVRVRWMGLGKGIDFLHGIITNNQTQEEIIYKQMPQFKKHYQNESARKDLLLFQGVQHDTYIDG